MTKQETIQGAWIIEQLHGESEGIPNYNEDGWAKYSSKQNSIYFKQLEEKEWLGYFFYRPKSLEGIEDNNGWIKIKSEDDLPIENFLQKYHVANKSDVYTQPMSFKYVERRWLQGSITHYKPIEKPKSLIWTED
jgi:hypothetical protein